MLRLPPLRAIRISATGVALVLVLAGSAVAAQRYASPDGVLEGTCPSEAPCRIDRAINDAKNGDEVIVLSGDYLVTSMPLATSTSVFVHGVDPASRPRLFGSPTAAILALGDGSVVSDIEVEQLVGLLAGEPALELSPGATAERVIARSNSSSAIRAAEAQIRDTAAFGGGYVGAAISLHGSGASVIRNATVNGAGPGAYGITVGNSTASPVSVNIRNTIIAGKFQDIWLSSVENAKIELDVDYSSFDPNKVYLGSPTTTVYNPGPHNQRSNLLPPRLVDANAWEFDIHQLAGSPTIDAGLAGPFTGALDLDGEARKQGLAVDIGADELVGAEADELVGADMPVSSRAAPRLSKLRRKRRVFAVGRRSTPKVARTSRTARLGTTFSYVLNQDATVAVKIKQVLPGHRVRRKCRRRHVGEKRDCTRMRKRGVFFRHSHKGANSMPFSGRLRKRPLAPGNYRAIFTAFNVFGKSAPRTRAFRIVRR